MHEIQSQLVIGLIGSTEVLRVFFITSFHNKRPPTNDNRAHEDEVPVKRMRRSSSASQSGRNKLETPAAIKPRGHRNSSTSKSQIPAPLPEPTNIAADTHDSVFHPTVPVPRGRANSTSSTGSAASPAPTSSKTSRNTKARRQNRKSQDKKAKEPVVKQEPVKQETEQVLPFLASPPTPRGSISLRTEKDLQVTISDLDNLFDSPDEDEEDSKPVSFLKNLVFIHLSHKGKISPQREPITVGPLANPALSTSPVGGTRKKPPL